MTIWHVPEDDAISTVATARVSGGSSLVLTDGANFGTAGWPKLVVVRRGTPPADILITVLEFTGRTGNTLTGVTTSTGHADADVHIGDLAFLGPLKLHITELQDAVDAVGGGGGAVTSVFGRSGIVTASPGDYTVSDVTGAAPLASPTFTGTVTMPTLILGTLAGLIKASTGAISTASAGTDYLTPSGNGSSLTGITESQVTNLVSHLAAKAPLASPTFTGTPLAPTASNGTNTTQIATTAFVLANVGGGAVSSVFTRTGAIVATTGDYTVAQVTGAAPLASPALTGTPTFSGSTSGTTGLKASATASGTLTLPTGTDTLATQTYVTSQGYVTGNQTITLSGDLSGSGTTAITTTIGATKVTNAMLAGSIAASKLVGSDITITESQVTSLTTDLSAKAPLASPTFTGTPLAPTATNGTNTTQLATTAFVLANVGGGAVSSVFTRTGAIVATTGDYTVAQVTGAAPLASPTFTGTVTIGSLTGLLKTATGVVSTATAGTDYLTPSGNGSSLTGITESQVTNLVSDLAAKAPLASPALTGTPTFAGSTSGTTTLKASATASGTLTLPAATDTLATQTYVTSQGYVTGNQTITLTGDVTGTGTGSFATTIGATKVTNAMLAGSITATKLVGSDITITESQVTSLTTDLAAKAPLASPTFTGKVTIPAHVAAITTDTDGSTITFDCNVSDWHSVILGGNRTLALSNDTTGQSFTVILIQDGTGSRTVTWWSGIKWPGGTVPTLTTTINKTDVFTFKKTGSGAYFGFVAGQNL